MGLGAPLMAPCRRVSAAIVTQRAALHIQDAMDGTRTVHPRPGRLPRMAWRVHIFFEWLTDAVPAALVLLIVPFIPASNLL